jgi:predicted GIY-YIG superfamily endonuclease
MQNKNDLTKNTFDSNYIHKNIINKNEFFKVYVLYHIYSNKTYVGSTNNLERRIRQHNCIIKGGAKYTTNSLINKLEPEWKYLYYIKGFPDHQNALQAEWKLKNLQKKQTKKGIEGRIKSLIEFSKLDFWTSNSIYNNTEFKYDIYINENYKEIINGKLNENFTINFFN